MYKEKVESEGIEPSSEQAKTMLSTCLVTIYCRDAPRLVTYLRTILIRAQLRYNIT